MKAKRHLRALWFTSALLLAACGSGGDSSAPAGPQPAPAAPQVAVNYGIKQLHFSWPAVSGATHYRLLERPDAAATFTQVGADLTGTAFNHDIALHRRVNAAYRVQACNSAGCTASGDISLAANLLPAIGYFKASNTEANDRFGVAVALNADGTTLAVGAHEEDGSAIGINGNQSDNAASNSGAVYVFQRSGNAWTQQAYVKASNAGAGDQFGRAVALNADGSTLAVGSPLEASNATGINGDQLNNSAQNSGAVYVFTRVGGTWTQQAYVKASNADAGDNFGRAIVLSADGATLAVAAEGESSNAIGVDGNQSNNSAGTAGAVYIFGRNGEVWTQQAYVKASNTELGDLFGSAVALSADGATLAVGATREASNATGIGGNQVDNSMVQAGAVYIFTRSAGVWSQQAYLKASNTEAGDAFGTAVALSEDGSTLIVGSQAEDGGASGIDGNQSDNSAFNSGAVYVFIRSAGSWMQQAYLKASNVSANKFFGLKIALSNDGNMIAVAAYAEDSGATGVNGDQQSTSAPAAGAVYAFNRIAGVWSQQAYVKASNTEGGDLFGGAISLSADASTLAVGASVEASSATGVGGNQLDNSATLSGAVYLY